MQGGFITSHHLNVQGSLSLKDIRMINIGRNLRKNLARERSLHENDLNDKVQQKEGNYCKSRKRFL